MDIQKGKILISEPFLEDPNFERSVIFVCEHNVDGTVGFVLNRPIENIKLEDVFEYIDNTRYGLYLGGPVEQNLLQFIHRVGEKLEGSIKVTEEIYWGGNFEQLKVMLANEQIDKNDIRFFLGYSGWSDGQIEEELDQKAWILADISSKELFDTEPKELWRVILKNMGGKYKMISNYPIDPRMN